jgi:hypothetical protein
MTEAERIDRQTLLKRAAGVAGAVYVVPVLTSAAGASTSKACAGQKCKVGAQGDAKCFKKSGDPDCMCQAVVGDKRTQGRCGKACKTCTRNEPQCGPLEPCGFNCGCFHNAHVKNPGWCIDIKDKLCSSFQPCNGGQCPAGQCCFTSCCASPLCGGPCTGSGTGAGSVRKGGPGMMFR